MGSAKYQTDGDPRTSGPGFGVTVHPDTLTEPLSWRKPCTVFVNSMSDLFHARVPMTSSAQVFAVMAATPRHTYQILTKRPERARGCLSSPAFTDQVQAHHDSLSEDWECLHGEPLDQQREPWPLRNVWLGTSIESDEYTRRADALRADRRRRPVHLRRTAPRRRCRHST
jgi:protein gp37